MHALVFSRLPVRHWVTALCLSTGGIFGLTSCTGTGSKTDGANDSGVTSNDDDHDDDDDDHDQGRDSSSGNNDSSPITSSEAGSGVTTTSTSDTTGSTQGASTTTAGTTTGTSNSEGGGTATESNSSDPDETMETGDVECNASAAPAITQLGLETVVQSDDLTILVYAAQPPGSDDWYLVDALGYVRVFSGGVLQPMPFLDVSSEMQNSTFTGQGAPTGGSSNYDERGLLSIAFAPDYETSGKFYVTLIPTSGDAVDHDLVLQYTRSAENPLVADTSTRTAILDLEPGGMGYSSAPGVNLAKYHNASTALFGPDGMLYVGMGDGGGECNSARPGAPQDVASPYGKILRLDPNAPPTYAAAGNPFSDGGDPRVLHWGIRNPFRFSFDSLTGDFYFGDVGQWNHEEISFAPAGAQGLNFGWPDYESVNPDSCVTNITLASGATHTPPVFDLPHTMPGAANLLTTIVGGAVYRGSAMGELYGAYLFAEFYPNRPLRALYQCGDQTSDVTEIQKNCDPNQPNAACFMTVGDTPALSVVAAIVEGNDGELYLAANGNTLMKIVPAP